MNDQLEEKRIRNAIAYKRLKLNTTLGFIAMLCLIALIAICIFIFCEKGFGF